MIHSSLGKILPITVIPSQIFYEEDLIIIFYMYTSIERVLVVEMEAWNLLIREFYHWISSNTMMKEIWKGKGWNWWTMNSRILKLIKKIEFLFN